MQLQRRRRSTNRSHPGPAPRRRGRPSDSRTRRARRMLAEGECRMRSAESPGPHAVRPDWAGGSRGRSRLCACPRAPAVGWPSTGGSER